MKLIYKSEGGYAKMGAGEKARIIKAEGFSIPQKDFETVSYASEDGFFTVAEWDMPRTITLSGDIFGGEREIADFSKPFYYPGELFVESGELRRKISCLCISFEDIKRRKGSKINSFALQLRCDSPYFTDQNETEAAVASYENLVTKDFTLPCVFTKMIGRGKIFNGGEKKTYPKVEITGFSDGKEEGIFALNETTGAMIEICRSLSAGEKITIDTENRKITSSLFGDITSHLSAVSSLEDFYLTTGENVISVKTLDTTQQISGKVIFRRLYLSAVI